MFGSLWGRLRAHRYAAVIIALVVVFELHGNPLVSDKWRGVYIFFGAKCAKNCEEDCPDKSGSSPTEGYSALVFEPNLGQAPAGHDFVARNGPIEFLLSSGGADIRLRGETLRVQYPGSRRDVAAQPIDPRPGHVNYLLGNTPERWITDVPTFGSVRYRDVYPGIDVVYHGHGWLLEHDFVVSPGADPAQIRMQFEGVEHLEVDSQGALKLTVHGITVLWKKPELYQKLDGEARRPVQGKYRLEAGGKAGFEIGPYDPRYSLVIDPVVAYSTFYGRGSSEAATRIVADAAGNVYYTGASDDSIYPTTPGAIQGTALTGDTNLILTKLSADGKVPVYTTHFGGSNIDAGFGIALDASGNIYLTGLTNSLDFPVTRQIQSPAPTSVGDRGNCFVAKLNPAGSALVYSTLLGGSGVDVCSAIALDSGGSAHVAGFTDSRDFPTRNAFQSRIPPSFPEVLDAFVTKLSPDGASIQFSSYLGGVENDAATAIAVDAAGNAYITGSTRSTDFPATPSSLQTVFGGRGGYGITSIIDTGDAFAVKLSASGAMIYATYLGGARDDIGLGIAIDAQGNAYIAGSTLSVNFPVRTPLQANYGGTGGEPRASSGDAFVAKINPQGSALVYSTYLGGSRDERAIGIAVAADGSVYVTGNTLSSDFPVSADAAQPGYKGQRGEDIVPATLQIGDAFLAQISPSGSTLAYSSYMGGFAADFGFGVAMDSAGAVLVAGGTNSPDFPTTPSVAQSSFGGAGLGFRPGGDAFIIRYGPAASALSISSVESAASYATTAVSPGEIVILKGIGIGPDTLTTLQLDAGGGVAKTLAQVRILFDDVPAPVVYVSARQSSAIVPYAVSGRATTSVVVEYKGVRSAPASVPIAAAVPGLFSADASGRGQAAILNQDNSYNSAQNPATKGSTIQLFGTGEGITNPPGVDGRIASTIFPKPVLPMSVLIGATRIDTLPYHGAAPSAIAGLFQVNVPIPLDAPSGNVPVQVIVGTVSSQTGLTVAIR